MYQSGCEPAETCEASYGPYDPSQVTAGSQPDWYVGFLDGSTRLMPNTEWSFWGITISPNVILPTQLLPALVFGLLAVYPFIEAKLTGDKAYHNLLDRPRDKPVRTGVGVMAITFYVVLLLAGGNDIIAVIFHLSINEITYFLRAALFILPPLAYLITYRFCLSLQRADDELLHHGIESGTIRRLPSGEFVEETVPLPSQYAVLLTGADRPDRRALAAHSEHGAEGHHGQHAVAAPRAKGFFSPRGGVIKPPQDDDTRQLESNAD